MVREIVTSRPIVVLLAVVCLVLSGVGVAQELASYRYDSERYAVEYDDGPTLTYRTYRNLTRDYEIYELEVSYQSCKEWSFGRTLLKRAGLARSTVECILREYSVSRMLRPGQTARTTKTDRWKYDYYRIEKIAVYTDGSSRTVDTHYGYQRSDSPIYETRVY